MLRLAGCIIADKQGRLLLIHRNTDSYVHWEVPGGKVDNQENPRDTAARELKEELGIDVAVTEYIGDVTFVDRDKDMHYSFFAAIIVAGEPQIIETHLHDDVRYIDISTSSDLPYSKAAERFIEEMTAGRFKLPAYYCE